MRRRDLIKTLGVLPAAGHVLADGGGPVPGSDTGIPAARATFTADQWLTIAVVQDHLLPSEPADAAGGPGAREVRATAYLDRTLADPGFDPDIKRLIINGIGWLNEISEEREGRPFHLVDPGPREDLLRQIAATSAGERWLSNLISYTLEALLADPLYGGNPDGIGWRWLEHDPGQPRPTPDKIYGRLGRK
jgi:gluconate 2-dehydrogenase gamma chain